MPYEDFAKYLIRVLNDIIFDESLMRKKIYFEADGQYILPTNANLSLNICPNCGAENDQRACASAECEQPS